METEIKKAIVYPEYDLIEELEAITKINRSTWLLECKEMRRGIDKVLELIKKTGLAAFKIEFEKRQK